MSKEERRKVKLIEKGMTLEDVTRENSKEGKLRFEHLLGLDPKCTDCKKLLTEENWSKSRRKKGVHLCKKCARNRNSVYYQLRKLREKKGLYW